MKGKGTNINAVHNGKERKPSGAKKKTRAQTRETQTDGEECARTDGDIEMERERDRRWSEASLADGWKVRGKGSHCHKDTGHGSGYCGLWRVMVGIAGMHTFQSLHV